MAVTTANMVRSEFWASPALLWSLGPLAAVARRQSQQQSQLFQPHGFSA